MNYTILFSYFPPLFYFSKYSKKKSNSISIFFSPHALIMTFHFFPQSASPSSILPSLFLSSDSTIQPAVPLWLVPFGIQLLKGEKREIPKSGVIAPNFRY